MFEKNLIIAALAGTAFCVGGTAGADLLAFYNDGSEADAAAEPNIAAPVGNVTVSSIDSFGVLAGTGKTLPSGDPTGGDASRITRPGFATPTPAGPTAGSASGTEWFEARSGENQGTPTSTDNYFFFTLEADPGFALDLTSLKYDFWVSSGSGVATAATVEAFVSVDGGAFVSFGSTSSSDTGAAGDVAAVGTANLDLSSITGAESVEVRLGVGYSSGNSDSASGFLQGVQLEGDVVPEPGSLALLGLGGLCVLRRRRG